MLVVLKMIAGGLLSAQKELALYFLNNPTLSEWIEKERGNILILRFSHRLVLSRVSKQVSCFFVFSFSAIYFCK